MNAPFHVGDKVTSAYRGAEHVVRTVTAVRRGSSQSGWIVSADDGGGSCPACHRQLGRALTDLDSEWFRLVAK